MYNAPKPNIEDLPTKAQLRRSSIIAGIGAVFIGVCVYLPAEYGTDPTGVGNILGLTEMGEIKQQLAAEAAAVKRGVVQVPMTAGAIAVAMEQQKGATTEISSSIQSAANATRQAAENAEAISNVARTTGSAAGEVLTASAELSRLAETLLSDPKKGMQVFIDSVKNIKIHFETYSTAGN